MNYKWIGAILIIGSCAGFGISIAARQKREEMLLRQLSAMIDTMLWELPFQLTPLPDLVRHAAEKKTGMLGSLFWGMAEQMDRQVFPDAVSCMEVEMPRGIQTYPRLKKSLLQLGTSLGRFDLEGQLKGLNAVRCQCEREFHELHQDWDTRLRSYRVLGLCAGVALAILLI